MPDHCAHHDGTSTERAIIDALAEETTPGGTPLDAAVEDVDCHGGEAGVVLDSEATEGTAPAVRTVTETVDGVDQVHVEHARPEGNLDSFDRVVAVASAKGGVGKSTVATNLACALSEDASVAVFDADVHGPNVHRLFDLDGPVRAGDDDRPRPVDYDGIEVMSLGLLGSDVPLGWRGAMVHDAVGQLYEETAWRGTDTLVIDLPPGTGDVVLTTLETVPVDGLVVVTTPFHTAVTDTNRTIELFRDEGVPVVGAVLNMASFTCDCCGEATDLFDDAVADLDAPVLSELPFERALQGRPRPGETPPAFDALADAVDRGLDDAGAFEAPGDAVDIRGLPGPVRQQQVGDAFAGLDAGEQFTLVSDRDPTPVREFLSGVADVPVEAIAPFEVERKTPEDWVLTTEHP